MAKRRPPPSATVEPEDSARAASLRYVTDERPGFQRKRAGTGFSYLGLDGRPIRDRETLRRIRSLAIPPAWTEVWICPLPDGHLQATGRDARGRKQYRYHPRWREVRDETKYTRMALFGEALPRMRARLQEDLALPELPRNKVLATIVRLLETTFIRIGNEEYARANKSFGLTTMKNRHVEVEGHQIHFTFRGKGGKPHEISLTDRHLARLVKRLRELPGQDLFQYVDESDQRARITSADVNEYLGEIAGQEFTAKDFRTWAGSLLAAMQLTEAGCADTATEAKSTIARAVEAVSKQLGNTPAICRKCYIHPLVLEAFQDRALFARWEGALGEAHDEEGRRREEAALLHFLEAAG